MKSKQKLQGKTLGSQSFSQSYLWERVGHGFQTFYVANYVVAVSKIITYSGRYDVTFVFIQEPEERFEEQ